MQPLAVLVLDGSAVITDANDAAVSLLGPCIGRRCGATVSAREDGALICGPGCQARTGQVEDRTVVVRGGPVHMRCYPLASGTAVTLQPRRAQRLRGERLTPREREVLQLVAEGLSSDAIADRLDVAVERAPDRDRLGAAGSPGRPAEVTSCSRVHSPFPVEARSGYFGARL